MQDFTRTPQDTPGTLLSAFYDLVSGPEVWIPAVVTAFVLALVTSLGRRALARLWALRPRLDPERAVQRCREREEERGRRARVRAAERGERSPDVGGSGDRYAKVGSSHAGFPPGTVVVPMPESENFGPLIAGTVGAAAGADIDRVLAEEFRSDRQECDRGIPLCPDLDEDTDGVPGLYEDDLVRKDPPGCHRCNPKGWKFVHDDGALCRRCNYEEGNVEVQYTKDGVAYPDDPDRFDIAPDGGAACRLIGEPEMIPTMVVRLRNPPGQPTALIRVEDYKSNQHIRPGDTDWREPEGN